MDSHLIIKHHRERVISGPLRRATFSALQTRTLGVTFHRRQRGALPDRRWTIRTQHVESTNIPHVSTHPATAVLRHYLFLSLPATELSTFETTRLHTSESAISIFMAQEGPVIDPIASEWQRLASMDQQSPGFLSLLSTLTTGGNQSPTTKLRGENARIVLSALDEVGHLFTAAEWPDNVPSIRSSGMVGSRENMSVTRAARCGRLPTTHAKFPPVIKSSPTLLASRERCLPAVLPQTFGGGG